MTYSTHEMLLSDDEIEAVKSAIELVAAFVVEDDPRLSIELREWVLGKLEDIADRFPRDYVDGEFIEPERYTERKP